MFVDKPQLSEVVKSGAFHGFFGYSSLNTIGFCFFLFLNTKFAGLIGDPFLFLPNFHRELFELMVLDFLELRLLCLGGRVDIIP